MTTFKGTLLFHSETGTEGGYWAFQDDEFKGETGKEWSYEGLHILKDNDRLTVFFPADDMRAGEIAWSGVIDLIPAQLFTEDAFGMWIHADQRGEVREAWATIFMNEWPAELDTPS